MDSVWAEQVCFQTVLVSMLILFNYPARIKYNEPNVSLFLSSCLCLPLRAAVTHFQANGNWVSACGFYWNVPQHIMCEIKKTTKRCKNSPGWEGNLDSKEDQRMFWRVWPGISINQQKSVQFELRQRFTRPFAVTVLTHSDFTWEEHPAPRAIENHVVAKCSRPAWPENRRFFQLF